MVEGSHAGTAAAGAGVGLVVAAGERSVFAISGVGFSPAVRYFCHVRQQNGAAGGLAVVVLVIVTILT